LICHPVLVAVEPGIIAHHLQGEPDHRALHPRIGEDDHRLIFVQHHEDHIQPVLAGDLLIGKNALIGHADRSGYGSHGKLGRRPGIDDLHLAALDQIEGGGVV